MNYRKMAEAIRAEHGLYVREACAMGNTVAADILVQGWIAQIEAALRFVKAIQALNAMPDSFERGGVTTSTRHDHGEPVIPRPRARIRVDIGRTCDVCGNPTRNDGERCDRCTRAFAKLPPDTTTPTPARHGNE